MKWGTRVRKVARETVPQTKATLRVTREVKDRELTLGDLSSFVREAEEQLISHGAKVSVYDNYTDRSSYITWTGGPGPREILVTITESA